MFNEDLRNQMIISKSKRNSASITTKSILTFLTIWGLWLLTAYLVIDDHRALFLKPLIAGWTLWDIFRAAIVIVLSQLVILQAWSIYVQYSIERKRRQEHETPEMFGPSEHS